MTDAFIVRSSYAASHQPSPSDGLAFLTSGAQTGGALECAIATLAPQYSPPSHVHPDQDEALYVLEGTLQLQVGDTQHQLAPGDFAFVPWGIVHTMRNTGGTNARVLAFFTPSGLFEYCRAMMDDPTASFEDLAAHPASQSRPVIG